MDRDGTVHIRDGQFECAITDGDPRVAGTATYSYSLDRWESSTGDLIQFQ